MSILSTIEKLAKREASNPVVVRTVHTAWQAALGAAVASLSGTHGDVRVALMVGVAAAAAAVKTAVVSDVEGKTVISAPPAVDPTPVAALAVVPAVPAPVAPASDPPAAS